VRRRHPDRDAPPAAEGRALQDLGLLVIDEEQRFGVTDKESLKRLRTEVDVLTMTATPIPRTLYLALTGARDISTINTPPEERLPIVTHVGPYDPRLVRQAVLREMDRGGQVFFVHNRVQTILAMHARLERLVPEARLAVAHGQMPEKDLAQVMERFTSGEIDVLLSTSIIESGLDIPNANTLIVDRADTFGLAQLYQLRGASGAARLAPTRTSSATRISAPPKRRANGSRFWPSTRSWERGTRSPCGIWRCAAPVMSSAPASTGISPPLASTCTPAFWRPPYAA
jgi:RecG-like helicase